jgi:hypothetical protein
MTKAKAFTGLPKPLPVTGSIPYAAEIFYGVDPKKQRGKGYRLAKAGAIVTIEAGPRSKIALIHATARKLGVDPV